MSARSALLFVLAIVPIAALGCFEPPVRQAPPQSASRAVIDAPYDLTWDAVRQVVKKHDFTVQADDPDHGIVEAQAISFTLADADCGRVGGVAGHYQAEPEPGSTAVYNFTVTPHGRYASVVSIAATFTSPLRVPLHPAREFRCVSRGTSEKRLLTEIAAEARGEHRPMLEGFSLPKPEGLVSPQLPSPHLVAPAQLAPPSNLGAPAQLAPPPELPGPSQLPAPSELTEPSQNGAPAQVLTPGRPTLMRPELTKPEIH